MQEEPTAFSDIAIVHLSPNPELDFNLKLLVETHIVEDGKLNPERKLKVEMSEAAGDTRTVVLQAPDAAVFAAETAVHANRS